MTHWTPARTQLDDAAAAAFATLDAVFALEGEPVASDPLSRVLRVTVGGRRYYVKRYHRAAKNPLRRWFGRSRAQAEWENLQHFAAWGIPTATLVGWGLERRHGAFHRGALITAEIPDSTNLETLAAHSPGLLHDRETFERISRQAARIARALHAHGFTHNDLHWRNLLYRQDSGEVFLIDCPTGRFWYGPFLRYRIAKDLASLDKTARRILRRTQRLRFYLHYAGHARLDAADKAAIRRIMHAFEHRLRRKGRL
ncbi:heptose kinase [Pseudothauera nasutitermitis]|uniref:Heptose kinase n=1 Tax=Pseudothauera nasutitermitis TaxID=2565930 RepID=A0A4S4ATA9_9RHOO|nr:lipopolysaccharide kinase InaA family protein [Pseudothauera nasutitermitis]THF63145.1 heptose kinase [Pseudothauera nasutitermitis]